jgi:hypothetical protein
MKSISLLLITFLIFSLSAFAQDTSLAVSANGNVGIGTSDPAAKLDVRGDIAVTGTVDGVDISNFKSEFNQRLSNYAMFSSLNNNSVTVTTTWTKLNTGTHSFLKNYSSSKIEVYVNSRIRGGTFTNATGIYFEVRINDTIIPDFFNQGSINQTGTDEFLTILAVFENLDTGTINISIWSRTNAGSSSDVLVDPGGWGGSIIIKETW